MTDRLTAEDAARLLEGSTRGPWFTESDGIYNDTRSYMVTVIGDSDQDRRDAVLIAAAPALAAALADSVPKAEVTRLRDERNLFGHLLSRIVDHWDHSLGHVNEFIADDIEQAKRALAEGSDVLPNRMSDTDDAIKQEAKATEREPIEVDNPVTMRFFPPCGNCDAPIHPVFAKGVWFWAHLYSDAHCDAVCGPSVVDDPTAVWAPKAEPGRTLRNVFDGDYSGPA